MTICKVLTRSTKLYDSILIYTRHGSMLNVTECHYTVDDPYSGNSKTYLFASKAAGNAHYTGALSDGYVPVELDRKAEARWLGVARSAMRKPVVGICKPTELQVSGLWYDAWRVDRKRLLDRWFWGHKAWERRGITVQLIPASFLG